MKTNANTRFQKNRFKTMVRERLAVRARERRQQLARNRETARETHVVFGTAGANGRRDQCLSQFLGNAHGERIADQRVGYEWQMWTVLLDRAERKNDPPVALLQRLFHLQPDHFFDS